MTISQTWHSALASTCGALVCLGAQAELSADTIYTVRQTYSVPETEKGNVRAWLWMPEDRPEQKVLDLKIIEAPENTRISRDTKYGRSWIYAEANNSPKPLKVVTEFKVLRKAVSGMADPAKARPLNGEDRRIRE